MVKTCIICGRPVHADEVRRSSSARRQNIILMASLSLGGEIERSNVDALVDNACTDNKFFCHTHLVTAAQYISAEMAMAGRRFSHFEDPTAWASTAYVTLADIPPHLVESFNEMKNNDNIVITERDVCTFLNNALRKYHGTPLWPERIEDRLNFDEGASGMISSSAAGLKEGATLLDALQASAKQFDGTLDASDTVCHPSPSFLRTSHSEQKDPVTKGHYYLVKGEKLMQLFRFCPECGEKLRSTKLTAAGTAAIVEYVCGNCCHHTDEQRHWESQERTVRHLKERTLRGNVALSVAALTTGLRYAELELWARQLKLSFLSKAAFLKMLEWTRPAAEDVYCNHLRSVVESVQAFFKEGGGFSLSSNSAYDGLGYSSPKDEKIRENSCTYPTLNISFQRDMRDSRCASGVPSRASDKLHCDRTFYPIMTHPLYALMASMHANTVRLSEVIGKRKKMKMAHLSKKAKLELNSRDEHEWRDAIFREVLRRRSKALEGNGSNGCV
ncbi:hypothetical protein V3C99_006426 [Haemonchus contortus]